MWMLGAPTGGPRVGAARSSMGVGSTGVAIGIWPATGVTFGPQAARRTNPSVTSKSNNLLLLVVETPFEFTEGAGEFRLIYWRTATTIAQFHCFVKSRNAKPSAISKGPSNLTYA